MAYLIHVEEVWKDGVWENLIEFVKKHKCHLFLMPPQIDYQKVLNSYRGSKEDLEKILIKRYKILKEMRDKNGFKVGLHIHFSLYPRDLTEKEKEKEFFEGYDFIFKIFQKVDGIVFGWYKYDDFLEKLCKEKNLEIKHWELFGINIHDYDLPLSKISSFERLIKDFLRYLKYKGKIGKNIRGN
jgi:hypothetical protein